MIYYHTEGLTADEDMKIKMCLVNVNNGTDI